jgi:hypothetical protein
MGGHTIFTGITVIHYSDPLPAENIMGLGVRLFYFKEIFKDQGPTYGCVHNVPKPKPQTLAFAFGSSSTALNGNQMQNQNILSLVFFNSKCPQRVWAIQSSEWQFHPQQWPDFTRTNA